MSSDTPEIDSTETDTETAPETAELQEPSTEKAPGDEPTAPETEAAESDEPSHEAVGIGVIGAPLVDSEQAGEAAIGHA